MVEFTNAVSGEPVSDFASSSSGLSFSRGSKGFFAMGGSTSGSFQTSMPDGDYCDIISECQMTVTVSA